MNALHRVLDDPEHRYRPGAPSATSAAIIDRLAGGREQAGPDALPLAA